MDAFGEQIPSFNVNGSDKIKTIAGGFITVLFYMIILMYGVLKCSHLMTKHGPNISTFFRENEMSGKSIKLNERNFKMALTIEDYNAPRRQKNDPRYVKWLFMMHYKINGVSTQSKLSYHKCTDEELNEFYPVQRESEAIL